MGRISGNELNAIIVPVESAVPRDANISVSTLRFILRSSWTDRIWTLQEAVLANNPIVVCGDKCLDWRNLTYAVTFIEHCVNTSGLKIAEEDWLPWRDLVSLSANLRRLETGTLGDTNIQFNRPPWAQDEALNAYKDFIDDIWLSWQGWYLLQTWLLGITLVMIGCGSIAGLVVIVPKRPGLIIAIIIAYFSCFYLCLLVNLCIPHGDFGKTTGVGRHEDSHTPRRANLIETVVQEIRTRECSDPLDKVFGLYSILRNLDVPSLPPDYSRSSNEVHRNLFIQLLRSGRLLSILLLSGAAKDDSVISWIPSWTIEPEQSWISDDYIFNVLSQHATSAPVRNDCGRE